MAPITILTFYPTLLISYPFSWSPCPSHLYTNDWDGGSTYLIINSLLVQGIGKVMAHVECLNVSDITQEGDQPLCFNSRILLEIWAIKHRIKCSKPWELRHKRNIHPVSHFYIFFSLVSTQFNIL